MNKQYIKIPHIILEVLSYVLLIVSIVVIAVNASIVNAQPVVDLENYENPLAMIVLPICFIPSNLILSLILHLYPVKDWNMPCSFSEAAAPFVYNDSMWLLSWIMFLMGAVSLGAAFGYVIGNHWMGRLVLIPTGIMFLVIIVYILKMVRTSKKLFDGRKRYGTTVN